MYMNRNRLADMADSVVLKLGKKIFCAYDGIGGIFSVRHCLCVDSCAAAVFVVSTVSSSLSSSLASSSSPLDLKMLPFY